MYIEWKKKFWLIYPTLYEASFSGKKELSNLDYYFQDDGKPMHKTNQSFYKLNNIFWWSKVSHIIIKGWNFTIKSFSGQVVLFCYPSAISAYVGENWLSQYTGTIAWDHYARKCEFWILKKKKKKKNRNKTKKKSFCCVLTKWGLP